MKCGNSSSIVKESLSVLVYVTSQMTILFLFFYPKSGITIQIMYDSFIGKINKLEVWNDSLLDNKDDPVHQCDQLAMAGGGSLVMSHKYIYIYIYHHPQHLYVKYYMIHIN